MLSTAAKAFLPVQRIMRPLLLTLAAMLVRISPVIVVVVVSWLLLFYTELELTRFRGHCRSHESAVGVFHGQAQAASVHERVQG